MRVESWPESPTQWRTLRVFVMTCDACYAPGLTARSNRGLAPSERKLRTPLTFVRSTIPIVALALFLAPGARSHGEATPVSITIVCLGDSLTEGFGVSEEEAYPAILETRLRALGYPKARVVNKGLSASTSASGVRRLQQQLPVRPNILVLELGINDGLRGVPLAEIRNNLAETIALAKKNHIRVLLAGMQLPPSEQTSYARDFQHLFEAVATEQQIPLIPFFLEDVANRPDLNLPHSLHPNARGYQTVADTVLKYVLPLLQ